MKEVLITARTRVDIRDIALSLSAGQASFIKEVEYHKSKDLQDLLKISAITVQWVDRNRLRKVPDMKTYATPEIPKKATHHRESSGVLKSQGALPQEAPPQEGQAFSASPQSIPGELVEKIADMDRTIQSINAQMNSLGEIRKILQGLSISQDKDTTPAPQAAKDVEEDTPMFIPKQIVKESDAKLDIAETSSNMDLSEAASSLKSARRKKK